MHQIGTLFTVSAPSGAGKTSLLATLLEQCDDLAVSISHTTRPIRPGEEDGKNYHFVNQEQFNTLRDQGDFLEHAEVFGNFYGTSKSWVEQQLQRGIDVILEIDWQGAAQVRRLMPDCLAIFIIPPSRAVLEQRLKGRGQDEEAVIQKRLAEAQREMSHYVEAHYLVVNEDFNSAVAELKSIIQSQRLTTANQAKKQANLLVNLLS